MTIIDRRVYSGTSWETQAAYCRARRVGDQVFVAGTTAVDENGAVVGADDIGAQARYIFHKIRNALEGCEAGLQDVVRTRMFVTRMAEFEKVAQAHRETFAGIDPVASCIGIACLVDPKLLIEIEVDAVVQPKTERMA